MNLFDKYYDNLVNLLYGIFHSNGIHELYLMIMYGGVFSLDLSDLDLAGIYNQVFFT